MSVYRIRSHLGNKVYYGSTTQSLKERFRIHNRRNCISSILFEEYGYDNCMIEEVEHCTEDQLKIRERFWIESDPHSVNIKRPIITREEDRLRRLAYNKEWVKNNSDKRREIDNERYQRNKEKRLQYAKDYYQRNREAIKLRRALVDI